MRTGNTRKEIFTTIYKTHHWKSSESVSGPGSELCQTESLRYALPIIFKKYNIKTVLDIPCGDFNWMRYVNMSYLDRYVGADIVKDIVQDNSKLYTNQKVSFQKIDIVEDTLPMVDLVFTRDCFVHLSNIEVLDAIKNIAKSKSKYFLSTTYQNHSKNEDTSQGKWRPINLNRTPFNLPPYIDYIDTDFQDSGKNYPGNGLGLWRIENLLFLKIDIMTPK
ncbi:MAG: hypothetical protein A3A98_01225 [Candidatus Staskawiczbacteria bacterium RIFCSPLOWO2_01_FULL_40_39]|uniref:Methyltransferase domain-containing protein n=1 Tax=Candidatus Staskawiczbacteria bacterium RIFCSPHIGHO2_01_FULL_39_25 TaxID=1802202 RepID=A0A1G2HNT3_9BACT|nr:MAG: hypothetical protein A2730_01225 [Candidatus Staskawiczbacteria bacterium RIFCSPHIGHO2_01_FULL_39_25]OGZ73349.1 MAG: hypothetical protein A3A98_01225 [Candidatus Staskawiczbacteria bacterium RIFCSPLOWO2_01_FULL_40_39]OGZ76841.1 MAG: hypothetical protein A3I87_01850 [Candidatus Staskawiczbacteria bacterium RIFCSPLOWO2_02_FULL_39_8]